MPHKVWSLWLQIKNYRLYFWVFEYKGVFPVLWKIQFPTVLQIIKFLATSSSYFPSKRIPSLLIFCENRVKIDLRTYISLIEIPILDKTMNIPTVRTVPNEIQLSLTNWCRAVYRLIHLYVQYIPCKLGIYTTNQVFNNRSRYTSKYDFGILPCQPTCLYQNILPVISLVCFSYFYVASLSNIISSGAQYSCNYSSVID